MNAVVGFSGSGTTWSSDLHPSVCAMSNFWTSLCDLVGITSLIQGCHSEFCIPTYKVIISFMQLIASSFDFLK